MKREVRAKAPAGSQNRPRQRPRAAPGKIGERALREPFPPKICGGTRSGFRLPEEMDKFPHLRRHLDLNGIPPRVDGYFAVTFLLGSTLNYFFASKYEFRVDGGHSRLARDPSSPRSG